MTEHQQHLELRSRLRLPGKIYFNDRKSVYDCTVRNLSNIGARLTLGSTIGVPHLFTLYIPRYDETHKCRLTWANMNEIEISFDMEKPVGQPDLELK